MSGRKRSAFQLAVEQQRRYVLATRLSSLHAGIRGLRSQMLSLLDSVPSSLLAPLSHDLRAAKDWLAGAAQEREVGVARALADSSLPLEAGLQALETLGQRGEGILGQLRSQIARGTRALADAERATARLRAQLAAERPQLAEWLGSGRVDEIAQQINELATHASENLLAGWHEKASGVEALISAAIEAATRTRQISEAAEMQLRLRALDADVTALLGQLGEGLRASFPSEVAGATEWQRRGRSDLSGGDASDTEGVSPESRLAQLHRDLEAGRDAATLLDCVLSDRAPALRASFTQALGEVRGALDGSRELMRDWFGAGSVNDFDQQAAQLARRLDFDDLSGGPEACSSVKSAIEAKAVEAHGLEDQHQKRLYMLESFRASCKKLGFGELGEPVFERPGDKSSRIKLNFDTYDQGILAFSISLDRIDVSSAMSRGLCYEEFGALSRELSRRFGVMTKFERTDGSALPRLLQKGEREEPDEGQSTLAR